MVPKVIRNGPGYTSTKESWSHEWWEMVPTSIWMSIPIHRFIDPVDWSRSISTVDKDSPTGEYGRFRRSIRIHLQRITVDGRWCIKIRDNFVVDFIDDTCEILWPRENPGKIKNIPCPRTGEVLPWLLAKSWYTTWTSYLWLLKSTISIEKVKNWIFDTIRDWRTRLENKIGEWQIATPNWLNPPPPPGGFLIYYVPSSRTVCKRTPLEEPGTNPLRGVLLHTVLDEGT